VIGAPPLETGSLQVTVAEALPGVALTLVGAPGVLAEIVTSWDVEALGTQKRLGYRSPAEFEESSVA
jgi:hypothetical protein